MKPSHLQTPRTLNECIWTPGYQRASFKHDPADRIVMWACIAGAIAMAVLFVIYPELR